MSNDHTNGCKFLSFDMVIVINIISKKSLGVKFKLNFL